MIGKLRNRIKIQEATEARDDIGGITFTWRVVATRWGSIEPLAGREYFYANQTKAGVSHLVTIRYFQWLTPSHRLVFNRRIFYIDRILNVDEKNWLMKVSCLEVAGETTDTSSSSS